MSIQTNIKGEKMSKKDIFVLNYSGPSFDNRMELHSFTRQINSVEKLLREVIDTLNKNKKIQDSAKDSKYYLELRRGSFETAIIILFAHPILTNIVSNCIFEYFKFLLKKEKSKKYKSELKNLTENKSVRKFTKDIFAPCVSDSDRVTIVQGDVTNNIKINYQERNQIENTLKEIEDKIPTEEYEQELIGQIKKVDATKVTKIEDLNKTKLGFVIEGQTIPIEVTFKEEISEDELRKIFFKRLKINGKVTYRGEDMLKIIIKNYKLSPIKKISDYTGT